MRFRAKDLMVSVGPAREIDPELAAKLCLGGTRICIRPTLEPCRWASCRWGSYGCHPCTWVVSCLCTVRGTFGCGQFNSCGPDGSVCDPTVFCGGHSVWEIENPEDLVAVRKELHQLAEQLDRLEAEGLPTEFRTRAEAEEAEAAMEAALEEIRRQKENL